MSPSSSFSSRVGRDDDGRREMMEAAARSVNGNGEPVPSCFVGESGDTGIGIGGWANTVAEAGSPGRKGRHQEVAACAWRRSGAGVWTRELERRGVSSVAPARLARRGSTLVPLQADAGARGLGLRSHGAQCACFSIEPPRGGGTHFRSLAFFELVWGLGIGHFEAEADFGRAGTGGGVATGIVEGQEAGTDLARPRQLQWMVRGEDSERKSSHLFWSGGRNAGEILRPRAICIKSFPVSLVAIGPKQESQDQRYSLAFATRGPRDAQAPGTEVYSLASAGSSSRTAYVAVCQSPALNRHTKVGISPAYSPDAQHIGEEIKQCATFVHLEF
ncbi:hypothetical protein C8R45DRAFT_1146199 [Mycena sanguinolenta]|nr:hypothetical protein C8R45DRAFT_1146199 [Mycena sanguinolenta]